MNVRWLRQMCSITALGSTLWTGASVSAGDHRMFPREPQRPHVSAACQPLWGYNQTCWQRFPPVAPCAGQSNDPSGQFGLTPLHGSQLIYSQMPPAQPFGQMPSTPEMGLRYPVEQREPAFVNPQIPMAQPPIPQAPSGGQMIRGPVDSLALPPLPGPLPANELPQQPVPVVPNQSQIRRGSQDYRSGVPRLVSRARPSGPGAGDRYGNRVSDASIPAVSVAGSHLNRGNAGLVLPQGTASATGLVSPVRPISAHRPVHELPATSARPLNQIR